MATPQPEVGTTVHFSLVGGPFDLVCHPAIVTKIEDGSELAPNETPRPHMVHLAVILPDGRHVPFSGIGYAPLAAGDVSGTWHPKHPKSEHEQGGWICGATPCSDDVLTAEG